jgi:AraC-like DNA-binding protein
MACHGANVVEHFYIHFDLVGISRPVVEELFGSPKFLPERVDFEKILKPLRNSSGNYLRKNAASLCYVKSLLYESFGKLLTLLEKDKLSKIERLASGNPRFADILRYIDSHLSAQLDNERLAELAQMSTSHFIRCFREDVGQPPAQYVLEQRIAAAARQLVHTEQSIEQIARQTGFGNRFYFTRAFSKVMSMPPAAYRKLPMV